MTVGVDIRMLAGREQGGVPEYTARLLERLIPLERDVRYKLFFSSAKAKALELSFLYPNAHLFTFRFSNRFLFASALSGMGPKLDHLVGGVDVWWSPHILPVLLSSGMPRVITVHDLSFVAFPEFLSLRRKLWHLLVRPRTQLSRATKLIAPSRSTQDDLCRLFAIPPSKIAVIYSGVSVPRHFPRAETLIRNTTPFILFLGVLEPRKNLLGLVGAFELLKSELRRARSPLRQIRLILAGPPGWQWHSLKGMIEHSPYRADCELLGLVDEEEKAKLLSQAQVFLYPSFLEGFGFPPLEAMAQGVPVVAGANSSMAELLEEAALLVDPWQPTEIAKALREILEDGALRQRLIRRGKERAQGFSWEETARKTLHVLREVAQR